MIEIEKILYVGDSHMFHCFSSEQNIGTHIVDITLNQIRKTPDIHIKYDSYHTNNYHYKYFIDENGQSLIDLINENTDKEYALFSIGEIDIRFHLEKQLSINDNAIEDIIKIYEDFLLKIDKKIILCSAPPPTRESLKPITKEFNTNIKKLCETHNFYYVDIYTDYQINGLLSPSCTHDGCHLHHSLKEINIKKLKDL